ncbi:spore coat protein CotZ [Rummeliibacillus stabekisii]|uniref:Spore coat protein CotZ n=1 Tax=Rummeliibacillus stabekisii TaxID=241244 RepID=A0A143HHK5_9BACL|nr:spore coat protein CotZ [Rummeliibacillus stabekisii]
MTSANCVCDVVQAILDIQTQDITNDCQCPSNCFLEPLGGLVSPARSNADTRVFMLLTKDGTPFKAFFKSRHHASQNDGSPHHHGCFSVFFRVEDVFDGCCATLRVLKPNKNIHKDCDCGSIDLNALCDVTDFALTDSCITVDLNCFCGVQCIQDVFLNVCPD